eukprot:snap_masked-scaffold_39-processed-gene-2.37-mRNA-1 protein AED:1.00 eAED:1.00 QI:0/-1/0/0/-1/1/1/0/87
MDHYCKPDLRNDIDIHPTLLEEVKSTIESYKNNRVPGEGKMHNEIIKASEAVQKVATQTIQNIFRTGEVSQRIKRKLCFGKIIVKVG